jgi:hypothetical protein
MPVARILADDKDFPVPERREHAGQDLEKGPDSETLASPEGRDSDNFPVLSLWIREFGPETGSLSPASTAT